MMKMKETRQKIQISEEVEEVVAAVTGINLYQFEPYASDSEPREIEEGENPEEYRLEDKSW